jgi:hypothetical protein
LKAIIFYLLLLPGAKDERRPLDEAFFNYRMTSWRTYVKPTDYPLPYSVTDNYQLEYPTNPPCYWPEEPTTIYFIFFFLN